MINRPRLMPPSWAINAFAVKSGRPCAPTHHHHHPFNVQGKTVNSYEKISTFRLIVYESRRPEMQRVLAGFHCHKRGVADYNWNCYFKITGDCISSSLLHFQSISKQFLPLSILTRFEGACTQNAQKFLQCWEQICITCECASKECFQLGSLGQNFYESMDTK